MDASQRVYNAAVSGDTQSLAEVLQDDKFTLDRCIREGRYTKSPLHVAVNAGHLEFTKELLHQKPELAEEVDQVKMWSPLHMASARGHLEIIEALIRAKPRMCFAYDRDGMTPVHIAVVNENLEALQYYFENQPLAVREPTSRGETVLHLCVKINRPDFLRSLFAAAGIITDENGDLLKSPDINGNTNLPPVAAQNKQGTEIPSTHVVNSNGQRQNNNGGGSLASMCLVRDQNGRTPIHVAAANGDMTQIEKVLKLLHRANRYAAQERTTNGVSVLHLCVKHNQLDALKSLINLNNDDGDQLINSKENNGNTILHLAVTCSQLKMVEYLLVDCKLRIEIDAVNNKDMTAVDVYKKQSKELRDREIKKYLKLAKAKRAKNTLDNLAKRLEEQRSALMVVASLIATMAFQAGLNPPGGVYQDTEKGNHEAGFAIWPYYYDDNYNIALISNTVAFVSSISVITLLISGLPFKREWLITVLRVTLWIAAVATSVTYAFVLTYVTRINDPPLNYALKSSYGVWVYVMVFILLGNVSGFIWRRKDPIIVGCFRKCFNANNLPL